MSASAKWAAIEGIAQWTAVGNATFAISHRFPFARIIAAHETVEDGRKIGHVVLTLP